MSDGDEKEASADDPVIQTCRRRMMLADDDN